MEIWKPVVGYEGLYEVSNLGKVKSLNYRHTGLTKILKQRTNNDGYKQVNLYKNGKMKNFRVHRLVVAAFLENPNNYKEVNHIDENKENNHVENLEWCTREYNQNYGTRTSKKTLCITTGEIFNSTHEASRKYNVDQGSISKCCKGKRKSAGKDKNGNKLKWKYILN